MKKTPATLPQSTWPETGTRSERQQVDAEEAESGDHADQVPGPDVEPAVQDQVGDGDEGAHRGGERDDAGGDAGLLLPLGRGR